MDFGQTITGSTNIISDVDDKLALDALKDPVIYQTIYDRWVEKVYHFFYFRTNNPTWAEDLTSQLFLSAYQALPRYYPRGHFAAWLFTIARNLWKEYYRKSSREVSLEIATNIPFAADISDEVTHLDEIAHLRQLIQSLPENEQELIQLRYVSGLSFADMAIVLKKNESAVKKSLYRLQARLLSLME